jgi:hypothetical protein
MRKLFMSVGLGIAILTSSFSLFAHHGTAAFDTTKMVTVKGTMTEFRYINPHVRLLFDVKNDKGEVEQWQAELTAPTKLSRAGWDKDTLKVGDTITASGYITKDGTHMMWIDKLIGSDGQNLKLHED